MVAVQKKHMSSNRTQSAWTEKQRERERKTIDNNNKLNKNESYVKCECEKLKRLFCNISKNMRFKYTLLSYHLAICAIAKIYHYYYNWTKSSDTQQWHTIYSVHVSDSLKWLYRALRRLSDIEFHSIVFYPNLNFR